MPKNNGPDFSAPIPGQSLTDTPKNAKWERPPQFTDLEEACNYVFEQMTKPRNAEVMITLLEKGVPIEALVRTIVFGGFAEGKWSVDLAMLMVKPVMYQMAGVAAKLGLRNVRMRMPNNQDVQALAKIHAINFDNVPRGGAMQTIDDIASEMGGGLMSPMNAMMDTSHTEPGQLSNPLLSPTRNVPLGQGT